MRWENRRSSQNVEDRRNQSSNQGLGGRRQFMLPRGKMGLAVVAIVIIAGMYGIDLTPLITGNLSQTSSVSQPVNQQQDDEYARFTSVILASTEDVWHTLFKQEGLTYQEPRLVLFRNYTPTACGTGQSAMGPFYCPPDKTVYIDLSFYEELKKRHQAGGDFAQAYVIAHEVGHHVQNLLGIADKVQKRQAQSRSQKEANQLSVRLELQADCFAGVWGYHMKLDEALEPGDLEEALNAAQAIGDDTLQKKTQGYIVPDSFTHGTAEQRHSWFKRGFEKGTISACNTFN